MASDGLLRLDAADIDDETTPPVMRELCTVADDWQRGTEDGRLDVPLNMYGSL